MKKLALALVALGLLTGCFGGNYRVCKPGGTQASHSADNFECRQRARQMAQFGGVYNPFEENSAYTECMQYKGWSRCPDQ